MAGLGNKRKSEERRKRHKPQHLDLSTPVDPAKLSPAMRSLLDALAGGVQSLESLTNALQLPFKNLRALLGSGIVRGLVAHGAHPDEYILGKRAPQRRLRGDGQSDDSPLLDLVPVDGRVDLAHISIRDIIQLLRTQLQRHVSIRRMFDPVIEAEDYDRWDAKVRADIDDIRKCVRAENEINPGLAVDCVSLLIPGLNMPALDAQGRVVVTEAELDGNQAVVDSLMAKPKEIPK